MKTNFKRISKRSLALLLGILMLLSTLMVGTLTTVNAVGASNGIIPKGEHFYYDFRSISGQVNYCGDKWAWTNKIVNNEIIDITLTEDMNFNSPKNSVLCKTAIGGWYNLAPTKPDDGQNMVIVAADGKSYTWGTYGGSSGGDSTYYLSGWINKGAVNASDDTFKFAQSKTDTDKYTLTYTFTDNEGGFQYVTVNNGTNVYHPANHGSDSGVSADDEKTDADANGDPKWKVVATTGETVTFTWIASTKTLSWVKGSTQPTTVAPTTAPATTPTEAPTPATTYYIVGNQFSNWAEFKSMTVSEDGTYSYFKNTFDSLEFKITNATNWDSNQYDFGNVDNENFNGADVTLGSSTSTGTANPNVKCTTNPCYILVYHPKTALNTGDAPIICASTVLPQGKQYTITSVCDEHSRIDVPASAAEGEKVEFSPKFDAGYELNSITATNVTLARDETTGMYSFTMPAQEVTIKVTSKQSEVTAKNKYYIRGTVTGVGGWDASAAMTPSTDGFYEYYEVTNGAAAQFLIDKDDSKGTNGYYNQTFKQSKFNGTDVEVSAVGNNSSVASQSGKYYIIVYYPKTDVNATVNPIICASTTLPEGLQQIVKVHAKDGTIVNSNKTKYAEMGSTKITESEYVTDIINDTSTGELCHHANARVGKEITITTTILGQFDYKGAKVDYKDYYLVKGWVVNGYSVGIRDTDTVTADGVYTTTFTIDPMWIDEHNVLEITPVYYYAINDTNKDAFFTFYVEDFDDKIKETWGNTISCYPYYYYYNDKGERLADQLLGEFPGQPMLKGAGNRYFVQVPKWSDGDFVTNETNGNVISGITLSNYAYNTKHGTLFGTTNSDGTTTPLTTYQSYDYDDFKSIIRSNPDVSNIIFSFKYNGDYNNAEPNENGYNTEADIIAAGTHDGINKWQFNVSYNGDKYINAFGKELSSTETKPTKYLRAISNGYDTNATYVGDYATCWYIYAPVADNSGKWNLIAKLPPSALAYKDVATLTAGLEDDGISNKEAIINYYKALQSYTDYAVKTVFEGNAAASEGGIKRCAGKWYYSVKGQEVIGDIEIQYEDSDITKRGTYHTDEFTGTGVGKVTGADAHFTNEGAEPHHFVTTLENDQYFTMTAEQASGQYKFIGWYVLEGDDTEPVFLSKDINASARRNKSFTFIARYDYVDDVAKVEITYNFKDFKAADGEIEYTTDHNKSLDTPNSYSKSDSIIVPYVNNDAEIAKIVRKNAPMIHSDYYDYALNESTIKYSYNPTTKTVYATATMDDTPHVYTVTVNGTKYTGYYQNNVELFADEFGVDASDETALWYLVDGDKKTLYYDDSGLNYRFIVDNAQLEVVANDGSVSLDGKSAIYNSNYELGYKDGKQKITQNFYITDYLDNAYNDDGTVVEGATKIKYVGGGILYYSSDENGVALNSTASAALGDKEAVINGALGNTYTADKNGTYNKVGYVYSAYDSAKFRYSEFLIAYQHIIGITLNNTDANAGRHISAYSFFVYTYEENGTTKTQIQISDTMAVATAYEPK